MERGTDLGRALRYGRSKLLDGPRTSHSDSALARRGFAEGMFNFQVQVQVCKIEERKGCEKLWKRNFTKSTSTTDYEQVP